MPLFAHYYESYERDNVSKVGASLHIAAIFAFAGSLFLGGATVKNRMICMLIYAADFGPAECGHGRYVVEIKFIAADAVLTKLRDSPTRLRSGGVVTTQGGAAGISHTGGADLNKRSVASVKNTNRLEMTPSPSPVV